MSFFNARGGGAFPGTIEGNPTTGLRHRVAVCIERVLDSCMKQENAENTTLILSNISPTSPKSPYKFISAVSTKTAVVVSDLAMDRLEGRPEFSRIRCFVTIPLCVTFEDSSGQKHTAESHMNVGVDVILYVPKDSIFPFEVKATAAINCQNGKASGDNAFVVTASYTLIIKITATTDLLLPTYGFCQTPRAVDFQQDERNEYFDLPLYPSGR